MATEDFYQYSRKGEKYGALTVVGLHDKFGGTVWWNCRCKCGQLRTVEESRLLNGRIATCIKCEVRNKEAKL